MKRFITFGEIMLRLKSPGYERLLQSQRFEATFGGGEANVAVSLANYGLDAAFVTVLPDNPLTDACLRELRSFGVDTGLVVRAAGRLGVYYLEGGAVQRPSKVIYDREGSAIALAGPGAIDWNQVFDGASWFHITGITPAISQSAADLSREAVRIAKERGLTVSCDLNHRKNLWKYGKTAREVMPDIVRYTDVVVANEEDCQLSLGLHADSLDHVETGTLDAGHYEKTAALLMQRFPNVQKVAITMRESRSANHNGWSAALRTAGGFYTSRHYDITDIVDRVGGGDSFAGGLIYGLNSGRSDQDALAFAVAASCLKHTIPGDYNRVTVAEVEALMKGSGSGRVER